MITDGISKQKRDFIGLKQELINYTRINYPDLIQNFNDASLYTVLLELNAAIADNLHYHIDRVLQETFLFEAQKKQSVYAIAKTYGLKVPGKRPSVSIADFTITVPVLGDKEDNRYLGILKRGSQVIGAGNVFETMEDVDFSSPFDESGRANRTKIPVFDASNNLVAYNITKRVMIINGVTKIFKKVIRSNDSKPFFKIYLPDKDVLSVTDVIHKDGTTYGTSPTSNEFITSQNKWYEVKSLIQKRIFVPDNSVQTEGNIVKGKYINIDRRFLVEYTPEGFAYLTFGGGNMTAQDQLRGFIDVDMDESVLDVTNNISLGRAVQPNTTLFIRYRVGGGLTSNVGVGVINTLGEYDLTVTGPDSRRNRNVINSLRVTNVTAAIGGADKPSIDDVKHMVAYNFAAQDRAVTLNDYKIILDTMPSKFGSPSKVSIIEEENKIKIKLLSYDASGNLTTNVSNVLRENVSNYLSEYRMINDFVEVETAEIVDLGVEADVIVDSNVNQNEVVSDIIDVVESYFNTNGRELGEHLYLGALKKEISNIAGVSNLVDLRLYNKLEGNYSDGRVAQGYVDTETLQVVTTDETLFMRSNQIYQIRFPEKDIKIRTKRLIEPNIR